MSYAVRLACFVAVSAACHLLLARGMGRLPARPPEERPAVLQVQLREPPPAPPPEPEAKPEPDPKPEARPQPAHRVPALRPRPTRVATQREPPQDTPPLTERPAADPGQATGRPTFGISMESTSSAGSGPAMPVGNTVQIKPRRGPAGDGAPVKPLPPPVPAYEVTRMPLPRGRCSGKYTVQARQAGLEGTVVLDLVVGEDGRTRDIIVVQGLGQGLTEAAIAAAKSCRFTPGEREGRPVPVRVRGFKIRFYLQGGD